QGDRRFLLGRAPARGARAQRRRRRGRLADAAPTRLRAAGGLELSRRVNEFIAELCRTDPTRLMGMGMVPMQARGLAAAELSRVREMDLVAVEIASNVVGRALHGSEYEDFWAEAERLDMPVF